MLGQYWVPAREPFSAAVYRDILKSALDANYDIVIDNMNLNPETCREIEDTVTKHNDAFRSSGYFHTIEYKDFFISLDEAITRDSLRPNPIGAKVIKGIYHKYRHIFNEPQINRPILEQNSKLLTAIVLDLDGTLAINTSGRSYYGEEADNGYLKDTLNKELYEFAVNRVSTDFIIIISGREDTELGRKNTVKWLYDNQIMFDVLLMRPKGDHRPDEVVKKELFEKYIKNNYYVTCVIDDRDKVVKMWRDLGLLCLQPWEGKF